MTNRIDTDAIANFLIEKSKDMDFMDYDDTITATFESLEATLYKLSSYACYNEDIKQLLTVLEFVANHN